MIPDNFKINQENGIFNFNGRYFSLMASVMRLLTKVLSYEKQATTAKLWIAIINYNTNYYFYYCFKIIFIIIITIIDTFTCIHAYLHTCTLL